MRDREWVFGGVYCTINNFIAIVTVAASVLNLTAMSIDRLVPVATKTFKGVRPAVLTFFC
jgi:tachykinin receptor 3